MGKRKRGIPKAWCRAERRRACYAVGERRQDERKMAG
jgi:hypothetical protein